MTEIKPNTLPRGARILAFLGGVIALIIAGAIVWQAGFPEPKENYGGVRPFTTTTIEGHEFTLNGATNQPVIINFWATWCVPCALEMPRLEQTYQDYQDDGLIVVGVNSGNEDPRDAFVYAINHDLTFPLVMDEDGFINESYEVRGVLPTTVFIDANGKIRQITYGILTEDTLQKGLTKIGLE